MSENVVDARWRAMTVALIAAFMTLLDVSIVNVALPSIQNDLGLSSGGLQWVLSGYALAFGLVLVPAGRFGDAHGRRRLFVLGLAGFTVASAAAGFAQSELWLICARLVQGASAGVVNPQVSGLVQQMFKPAERGRPFGALGATIGVSTALGPLLGGAIIAIAGAESGWRWIFFINIPVGVVAITLGSRWIPGTPAEHRQRRGVDPVGVVLLGGGVALILLPLVQQQQWHGPIVWILIVAGLAVLGLFVIWELRQLRGGGSPLVDLRLFRRRSFALGSLVALTYFAGFTTTFFIFTLFLQNGLRYSPLEAGLSVTPFALGSASGALLGGRIVNRYGRALVVTGLCMVIGGLAFVMLALHFVAGRGVGFATALPLLVAGIGSGLVISPNQNLTLSQVPVAEAGSAGGVLQTGQRIGSAIGIAAIGAVFFDRLASSRGDYSEAFRTGLLVTILFMAIALVAATSDVVAGHRARGSSQV
ncbi:EmrB/QacA subfamily drug resistance transporter [Asanoa ferruginea]|uniref:EmrB/QacA subfamily drug resistance transporter n=1 Tax=Asanoa ferruginea TaxID=53367 RepID=A0A3D9ZV65_9ACTN|nr:MFS transporter [Asanoa ferruginea]REG00515.1 EmrB/QacA subfamily drug resistance transporter [Asanoa ferruginea]GIF47677.1 MFS transporter [Asanoa ferruginea]